MECDIDLAEEALVELKAKLRRAECADVDFKWICHLQDQIEKIEKYIATYEEDCK